MRWNRALLAAIGVLGAATVLVLLAYLGVAVLPRGSVPGPPPPAFVFSNVRSTNDSLGAWFNLTVGHSGSGILWSNLSFDIEAQPPIPIVPGPNWTLTLFGTATSPLAVYSLVHQNWTSGASVLMATGQVVSLWVDHRSAVLGCVLSIKSPGNSTLDVKLP